MALGALAITAIAMGGTGLGLQMKGQYEAGKAAQIQSESEAALREYNAQLAEQEAVEAQEAAAFEERKFRKGAERLKARQRTLYAKAGITPEGTPLDVMEQTATELGIDALMIRRGGQLGARGLTAEAQLQRFAGKSALLRGRAARRASRLQMLTTGLMGGAQLAYMGSQLGGKVTPDTAKATYLRY